ncbi:hypothetical protein H0H87_003130 [Tephrocybe sp. NHM501043]|nr:hypothetical protein H0H87_003130 [Tephrocybe sp. NHM501043]
MEEYHIQSIEDVPGILTGISSNLQDVVNGRINTPFWRLSPPMPSDFEDTKEGPPAIVKEINLHEFFVTASATEKTRLLYEGLFQHWGLYVTANANESGARALRTVSITGKFYGEADMVIGLPKKSALGYQQLLDSNLKALDRRFSAVLIVHLLVFREFLKTAHTERVINDKDLQRRWLLVQLSYRHLDKKKDIHVKLL